MLRIVTEELKELGEDAMADVMVQRMVENIDLTADANTLAMYVHQ